MIVHGTAQKAGKVLVINSDPEIIRILEVNLAHANLEVSSAQSGGEALNKLHYDESDIIILDTALSDISHAEMRRRIRELSPANRVPVIIIGNRPQYNNEFPKSEDNIIHCITKPFEPKEVVALVQGYLMHKERMENTNPMTGLPNRHQVSKEISRLIEQKATLAAIYISMHDFSAINKACGYAQGDRIIRLLADIVSESVRLFGNPSDLAGHFGGDKFLIISSPWKARTLCRRIIAGFNRRIKFQYSDEYLLAGDAISKSPSDGKDKTPSMSIHIAVVTNQKCAFHHPLEFIEAASEQIEILKNSTESNCYFDLKGNGTEPSLASARREMAQSYKEGLKEMQGVLDWFDFLTRELGVPLNEMKNSLQSIKIENVENPGVAQQKYVNALQDSYSRLSRIIEGITGLAIPEDTGIGVSSDEVDVKDIIAWVLKQVEESALKRGIKIDIETAGEIGRIIRDKKSLTQSLLYIIRSEVLSSPLESRLYIHLSDKKEESIQIKISNPDHFTSTRALNALLQRYTNASPEPSINELYLANILVRGMGGELEAACEKGKGTTYIVTIPKKWRSWVQKVDTIQLAMEISRKEAKEALKSAQQSIFSLVKPVTPEIKENFDRLSGKIQEMAVLCNRSLFLADDYNTRLEIQQDRLLQQEASQSAASEAILILCRDMAASMQIKHLFNPESAKRVADCSLAIAKEFRMSESDRQALYHAALFRDLALAFSRRDGNEPALNGNQATAELRERLNLVWRALSSIPCFSPACNFILYRWESFDGTGGSFGIKGADIPLGSRILAVTDMYHRLTSDRSPEGKLTPETAVQKILEKSGLCFDPHVVSAFLMLWKRKEMEPVLAEN